MQKATKPTLGNFIITNSKFKPQFKEKSFDIEPKLKGIIVSIIGDAFGIEFEKENEWTHTLDGLLIKKNGCFLERKQFVLDNKYTNKNKTKQKFVETTQALFYNKLGKIPNELEKIKNDIKYRQGNIKSLQKNIKRDHTEIKNKGTAIETLKKEGTLRPKTETFEKQFNRLMRASKVKDIEFHERYIIVNTKDLIYEKTSRIPKAFNLGAYKIFIPLNTRDNVRVINYKKHVRGEYFHPCIGSGGSMCTGDAMKKEMEEYRRKNQIDLLVFLLISFLEKPDYDGPHIDDKSFYCAQKVTIKPKNILDWISGSYWSGSEKWDSEKFNEDRLKM